MPRCACGFCGSRVTRVLSQVWDTFILPLVIFLFSIISNSSKSCRSKERIQFPAPRSAVTTDVSRVCLVCVRALAVLLLSPPPLVSSTRPPPSRQDAPRLLPALPLGVGRRLAGPARRVRLCGRHRHPHLRRSRLARDGASARSARGLCRPCLPLARSSQFADGRHGRRAAVGWLVRLQRGQRARGGQPRGERTAVHARRRRGRRAGVARPRLGPRRPPDLCRLHQRRPRRGSPA